MIIPLDKTLPIMIYEKDLHNIYVNGEWIGCTVDCLELVKKTELLILPPIVISSPFDSIKSTFLEYSTSVFSKE